MRTTVDIDDDLMRMLGELSRRSGQSLKKTLNRVVARGLGEESNNRPIELPSWDMGRPFHPIEHAWDIASEMELESMRHKLETRS